MINPVSFKLNFLGNKTYVVGHKNPDTDSVCSAIAQAQLQEKTKVNPDKIYSPISAGNINEETAFALAYFGIKKPEVKEDISLTVKEVMDKRSIQEISVHKDASVKEFGDLIIEKNLKTAPVLDDDNNVIGVVSRKGLAEFYLNNIDHLETLRTKNISYERIAKLLQAEVLTGKLSLQETIKGKVRMGAYSVETTNGFDLKDAIVVIGDRDDVQEAAIKNGAKCLIVTKGKFVEPKILSLAKENNVIIMSTKNGVSTSTRLLEQSVPVSEIMNKNVVSLDANDSVDEIKNMVKNTEYRYFPVLEDGKFIGVVNREQILTPDDNDIILVDHNSTSQFVKGAKKDNVVGIFDHHKLEFILDDKRIPVITSSCGANATLIAKNYKADGVEIPKDIAGILWCAIISDTDKFTSITTTEEDKKIAAELAKIAEIKEPEKLANELLSKRDADIEKLSPQELVHHDLKTFETKNKATYSIGQIKTFQSEKYLKNKAGIEKILTALDAKEKHLGSVFMITDLNQQITYLITSQNFKNTACKVLENADEEFLNSTFKGSKVTYRNVLSELAENNVIARLNDVQSRKEQIEPFVKKIIEY